MEMACRHCLLNSTRPLRKQLLTTLSRDSFNRSPFLKNNCRSRSHSCLVSLVSRQERATARSYRIYNAAGPTPNQKKHKNRKKRPFSRKPKILIETKPKAAVVPPASVRREARDMRGQQQAQPSPVGSPAPELRSSEALINLIWDRRRTKEEAAGGGRVQSLVDNPQDSALQTADIFLSTGVRPLEGLRPFAVACRATLESTRMTMRLSPEKARLLSRRNTEVVSWILICTGAFQYQESLTRGFSSPATLISKEKRHESRDAGLGKTRARELQQAGGYTLRIREYISPPHVCDGGHEYKVCILVTNLSLRLRT